MPKIIRTKDPRNKILFLGTWLYAVKAWEGNMGWYHAPIAITFDAEVKMRTIMRMRTDEAFRHPLHM